MKQRFAFLFPGQGSQHLGMLDRLSSIAPKLVKDLVAEANEACGMDLGRIINVGPSVLSLGLFVRVIGFRMH